MEDPLMSGEKKRNLFFKNLKIFCLGLLYGIGLGMIMFVVANGGFKKRFVFTMAIAVLIYLTFRFSTRFNFSIIFGVGTSVSASLIVTAMYYKGTFNIVESTKIFAIVFVFYFFHYLVLKLIKHTFDKIYDHYAEKNK